MAHWSIPESETTSKSFGRHRLSFLFLAAYEKRRVGLFLPELRFAFGIIKCFSKIFEVLAIGFWFPWLELNCLILFFLLSFVWKFGKTRSWDLINILWNFCLKIFPELLTFSKPLYSKNLKGKPYATKQMFVRYFHLSVCISCRSAKCQNILENYQTHWLNVDLPNHQIMIATAVIIIVLLQKCMYLHGLYYFGL